MAGVGHLGGRQYRPSRSLTGSGMGMADMAMTILILGALRPVMALAIALLYCAVWCLGYSGNNT